MLSNTLLSTMTLLAVLGLAAVILMPKSASSAQSSRQSHDLRSPANVFNLSDYQPVRARSPRPRQLSSRDWIDR